MNQAQITAIVRHVLAAGGALLVQHGLATASQSQDIAGGLTALVMVCWSLYEKREAATLAKADKIDAKNAPLAPSNPAS